jgi:hypothetical protein
MQRAFGQEIPKSKANQSQRYDFKGIYLGMTQEQVASVRGPLRCHSDEHIEGYRACLLPATEDDEKMVVIRFDGDVALEVSVTYREGMTADHESFVQLLSKKYGPRAARDRLNMGSASDPEIHDRSMFARGGDRAFVTSYSMAAVTGGAVEGGAGFRLLIFDVERQAKYDKKTKDFERNAKAAKDSADAARMKF